MIIKVVYSVNKNGYVKMSGYSSEDMSTKARNQSLAKSIGDVFVAFETSGIKIREWEAKFSELEEEFRKVA